MGNYIEWCGKEFTSKPLYTAFFNKLMPEMKKMNPRIARAQGLSVTISSPCPRH
jgi:hypothetical protein